MERTEHSDTVPRVQTKGLRRNTIDKYYTKPAVAERCLALLRQHIAVDAEADTVIEPSAGDGAFIPGIRALARNVRFYDLAPEHADVERRDYLQYVHRPAPAGRTHVVGNPPFGRQSSAAIRFIRKSCEFADSVSFILPRSFKKDSMRRAFPPHFHLVHESDLPDRAFTVDGAEHDVPCVFQVWERRPQPREAAAKLAPHNFAFVKQTDNPDVSVRRVGVNAGAVDRRTEGKSVQSHYFIRFANGRSADENAAALAGITYEFNNTVGPRSISKQELMAKFNPLL